MSKTVTWQRPHLTYFGKVAVLPGTHPITDQDAAAVKAHWSYERAAKAGLVVIAESTKQPAAEKPKADAKKPETKKAGNGKDKGAATP